MLFIEYVMSIATFEFIVRQSFYTRKEFYHGLYLLTVFNSAVDVRYPYSRTPAYISNGKYDLDLTSLISQDFANTGSATDVMPKQVNAVVREINVSSPLAHCYSEIIEAFGFRSTMFPFVEACQQFTRSQDVK